MPQLPIFILVIIVLCGAITDILYTKIYNWLTYPAIVTGVVYHGLIGGVQGLIFAISGLAWGLIISLPFILWGGLGGGDLKMIMAIGSLGGTLFLFCSFFYTAIFAGIYAITVLIWSQQMKATLIKIMKWSVSLFVKKWRGCLSEEHAAQGRILFGIPLCLGTFWASCEMMYYSMGESIIKTMLFISKHVGSSQ